MCAAKQNNQFEYLEKYYSDIEIENQIVAVIVRSPVASGAIRSISHPALPQAYTIITKKDLKWANTIQVLDANIPLLAYEKISYLGEAIALVCGPSIHIAKTIVQELEIEYTQALEDTFTLDEDIFKRSIFKKDFNEKTNDTNNNKTDNPKKKKDKKNVLLNLEKTYRTKQKNLYFKENLGCLADFSAHKKLIYTPSLWVQNLLDNVSSVNNVSAESIFIKKTISNNRIESNIWAETYLACLASYTSSVLNKPVFIQIDKKDELPFFYNSPEFETKFLVDFNSDGCIFSIEAHCQISCGAFPVFSNEIINRTLVASLGAYQIPKQKIIVDILKSENPPLSIDVNAIDAHAQFAIEVLMQDIAMELNIFPHEIRLKHLQENILPLNLESKDIPALIDITIEKSQYLRRYATYNLVSKDTQLFTKHKPCRGIGLSIGFQGNSFASSTLENKRKELALTLLKDESVIIHAHTHSKHIANIWKEMASRELSIAPEKIKLDPCFAVLKDTFPSTIHRNISITTSLIKKCAKEIESKRFHEALPIIVKKSVLTQRSKIWDLQKLEGKAYYSTAWTCAAVDLEINTYNYQIIIKRVWVSILAGKILNTEGAQRSLKRNILQQLARCLADKKYLNPTIDISFIQSDESPKEIGSLMDSIIPSAVHAALTLALQKPIPQLPLHYDSIFNLMKGKKDENTMHA